MTVNQTDPTPDQVTDQVRAWLTDAAAIPPNRSAARLAAVLKHPDGLPFTVGFVDGVIRPEDPRVASGNLRRLRPPGFLPLHLRLLLRLAALGSTVLPGVVIPIVRRVLRQMVGHLIVDARPARLGRSIAALRSSGVRLNLNLLGEAVLGSREAARRLAGTRDLLARPDVDYVSIKVSATVPPHSHWAFDEAVAHIADSLLPLFLDAADAGKFINLDMEEYRDLDLTMAVFMRLLDRPDLLTYEAGIVLQAYLPDALGALQRLQDWAAARRGRGGAAIKVRLVKGANLPMERVEAELHGWPPATWSSKLETDTNYKRVLRWALTPSRVENVRLGVAGHNLFDLAYAWLLASSRGVTDRVEFEMLLGMATGQAAAVQRTVGGLLLYTPVVHPREFDVAIAYLVRRLEEGASQDNFMSAVFDLASSPDLFERERARFEASLAALDDTVPAPHRGLGLQSGPARTEDQNRAAFANAADTDPAVAANREWGYEILRRVPGSTLGSELVAATTITDADELSDLIASTHAAAPVWDRPAVLRSAAAELESRRAELIEVMASECGKTIDQGDVEVSEAVDFANYYAGLAEELDRIDGARHVPVPLILVVPPWNFPVAIPAGSMLAGLAAGSSVIVKPAPQARRCGAVLVEALWSAGVPKDSLRLVQTDEGDLGRALVSDPRVGRLILTGSYETAELFRSFRPDLPLFAETSGKNAIVVTPSADPDLAVKDLVASAFSHAGQKCSAASLGILVGSVATSRRFREQLIDAVTSLTVGYPNDPEAQMGPVIEPVSGKLERALTTLGPGETWLVEPRRLDDSGRLWSPGVKTGVQRGSEYHLTEYFGPVLGLIAARDLDEAIEIQNEVEYGLTGGIHSLDREEIATWLDRVQVGNAYVNRGITGAIVRRQPFGGWKKSAVGPGAKAGGPNYLIALSDWERPSANDADWLERAFASDATAWADEFGVAKDVSGLTAERNVLRYLPVPVQIRYEEAAPLDDLRRVIGAGQLAGGPITVSSSVPLPDVGVPATVEDHETWVAGLRPGRHRLVGVKSPGGSPDRAFYDHPVTESGRIELLPFLREQAVSITAHRFGTPDHLTDGLLDDRSPRARGQAGVL